MASYQQWTYPLPEVTYNPGASSNISSYFVHPNRVVKPNSRNNSPRSLGRRKTTTAAFTSSRTRSVVDHLRPTAHWQNQGMIRSRPVSWHPDFFETSNFNFSPTATSDDSSCWAFSTAQVNGLVTPVPYPLIDEPQIPELFTPLDELPAQDPSLTYEGQHYHQQSWLSQAQGKAESYPLSIYTEQPMMQPTWHLNQTAKALNLPTAPSSPDCPPLQDVGLNTLSLGSHNATSKDGSEELIGMGLYDSPAEVQSCSLLFGVFSGAQRKGLKLEESFEPSELDDDEEEDAQEIEQDHQDAKRDEASETWHLPAASEYGSQSIASHLTFGIHPRPEPLAAEYLATLRQMNSAYYPSDDAGYGQGYGWI